MGNVKNLLRSLIVEFLGDFIFIFVGSLQGTSGQGVTAAAFTHGVAIFVLIASMGHISGGHYNPAVTLGVLVSGNIPIINGILYMVAQISGGFTGALLVRGCVSQDDYHNLIGGGLTLPSGDAATYPMMGITAEIVFTYFLVMTVLMTAVDTDTNVLAPIAIGFSILVDIFAGGNISGASMNPARTLGPAIAYSIFENQDGPERPWIPVYYYLVGPFVGAVIAALIYKAFLARDDKRWLLK